MPVRGLDHVQLAMLAGQEDVARGFYAGLLRIPEQPKRAHLAVRGGCWFESSTVRIHLGLDADSGPPVRPTLRCSWTIYAGWLPAWRRPA